MALSVKTIQDILDDISSDAIISEVVSVNDDKDAINGTIIDLQFEDILKALTANGYYYKRMSNVAVKSLTLDLEDRVEGFWVNIRVIFTDVLGLLSWSASVSNIKYFYKRTAGYTFVPSLAMARELAKNDSVA